jgi:phospholipid transport system substrate-binding protein
VFVRTKILRPGAKPAVVDYRMYKSGGSWKIYNLKVEGISLVTNYRTSFQREIRNGGLDGLIKSMKTKNDTRTAAL